MKEILENIINCLSKLNLQQNKSVLTNEEIKEELENVEDFEIV